MSRVLLLHGLRGGCSLSFPWSVALRWNWNSWRCSLENTHHQVSQFRVTIHREYFLSVPLSLQGIQAWWFLPPLDTLCLQIVISPFYCVTFSLLKCKLYSSRSEITMLQFLHCWESHTYLSVTCLLEKYPLGSELPTPAPSCSRSFKTLTSVSKRDENTPSLKPSTPT